MIKKIFSYSIEVAEKNMCGYILLLFCIFFGGILWGIIPIMCIESGVDTIVVEIIMSIGLIILIIIFYFVISRLRLKTICFVMEDNRRFYRVIVSNGLNFIRINKIPLIDLVKNKKSKEILKESLLLNTRRFGGFLKSYSDCADILKEEETVKILIEGREKLYGGEVLEILKVNHIKNKYNRYIVNCVYKNYKNANECMGNMVIYKAYNDLDIFIKTLVLLKN